MVSFAFQGRLYRGSFTRLEDGQIVNLVDLEAYLYSVVPAEMPPRWPPAALESAVDLRAHLCFAAQRSAPSLRSRAIGAGPGLSRHRGRVAERDRSGERHGGTGASL